MEDAPRPAPDFDAVGIAKELLRTIRAGALATLERSGGFPFASLVTVATDYDGSPLLLMSRLSAHTQNLEQDQRASILLAQRGKGDPLAHPRLTVMGRAARTDQDHVRRRFLARHPKAQLYAGFADFSFWRLEIASAHLNGGFARAMDLAADQIRTETAGAEELAAAEASAVEHMNADHREALALYAEKLAGAPPGGVARDRPRSRGDRSCGRRPYREGRLRPPRRGRRGSCVRCSRRWPIGPARCPN